MPAIEEIVYHSQSLGGEVMPCKCRTTQESPRIDQEAEKAGQKHGKSLYCSFHGKE
jgi:hypothetical protein